MEHKDRAIKAEMLRSELDEIRANLASVESRLSGLPAGDARAQYEKDRTEMTEELAAREKELSDVLGGAGGAESAAIRREMLADDVADIEENISSCEARLATSSGPARELYSKEISDLREELAQRRKELEDLG